MLKVGVTIMRYLVIGFLAISLLLAISDRRVLIWQHKVIAGEDYYVEGFGSLKTNAQDSLVCTYWTGWSVKKTVFWHSANNIFGRDKCAFVYNDPL